MLAEEIRRQFPNEEWVHTRGWVLERVYAHDIAHIAELNESFTRAGLLQIELWD